MERSFQKAMSFLIIGGLRLTKEKDLAGVYKEAKWNHLIQSRQDKQKVFFDRKEKGDLLLYINRYGRGIPYVAYYFYSLLANKDVSELLKKETIEEITLSYVNQLRYSLFSFYLLDDDMLPAMTDVMFHIGAMTSAMTGGKVAFASQTNWCKEHVSWEGIDSLNFNLENPWVQFALMFHQALWKFWDEDFLIAGYWHQSPLDAAWAIAGSSIFEKMHTQPKQVQKLVNWCCDWSISMENLLKDNVESANGFRGIAGTLVPDGAVFVNGDPIDLINPNFAEIFDLPYSSKLFTTVGGGFYHHHSIGLYQVPVVSQIEGIFVHHIANDYPATPDMASVIIDDRKIREQVIKASFITPIYLDMIPYTYIDKLLPILKEGRFILEVVCESPPDAKECIKKIKNINNLK